MPRHPRPLLRSGLLAAALAGLAAPAQAEVVYDTRALTGTLAPGTGAGVVFSGFSANNGSSAPVLNASGEVLFRADLAGLGVDASNGQGIWSDAAGSLQLIARAGSPAPGVGAGVVFEGFIDPAINSAGHGAFVAGFAGPGVDSAGIWSQAGGTLGLDVRSGQDASAYGAGVTLNISPNAPYNNLGQSAFVGSLFGPGTNNDNRTGIWTVDGGALTLHAREGASAPGTGLVFASFSNPALNHLGDVAFRAVLNGGGVSEFNRETLWLASDGSLTLLARGGDNAPGAGDGVRFKNFTTAPGFNNAGQIAFRSVLTGTGVDNNNDTSVWVQRSGSFDMLAREGSAAPGTGPGVVFDGFSNPFLNAAGHTVFEATLDGTGVDDDNDRGMWAQRGGALELIARSGNDAPGTVPGVVFTGFSSPAVNGLGEIAFYAELAGAGIDFTNDQGIWATDHTGQLTLVARAGDLFDVDDDPLTEDLRTIATTVLETGSAGEDGRPTSFNDAGELVFSLRFTDGSEGIFVATLQDFLTGDITDDGFVGAADLDVLLANWGDTVAAGPAGRLAGDLSGDGVVGQDDLDLLTAHWGSGTPAQPGVPEPGTLAVLGLAGAALLPRRRRA